ncbi:30S ribosomal protein S6 [Candidatus Nomurabacteria bacterium]|nr:30S ribosomal protein S6 [Candidatus Nomurabacteria bacterium]
MEENIKNTDSDARVYEVGYLLVPTIPGDEVPAVYGNLKELISSLGGEVIADEMPKQINLAYQMLKVVQNIRNKFDTAYFGWIKFEMNPEKVADLKKKMDLDPKVIRFLTTKTVKENTIATKKFVRADMGKYKHSPKKEGEETPVEINKEEIDKEIDAMVEA